MNVLSLFDGLSCGQIALKELGVKVDKYYASEVDKFAIEQTKLNFPNTIHLGDVTKVDVSILPKIDILIGGSPCQNFSFSGRMNGMTTENGIEITTLEQYLDLKGKGFEFDGQSYLFWEYVRILKEVKPKYFLLENVVMTKKWERLINETLGIHPVEINSSLVSAQNRVRLYWSNIRVKEVGLFGEKHTDIPQPKDRGIYLKDILEENVDDKFYLSDKAINGLLQHKERNNENGNGFGMVVRSRDDKSQTVTVGGKGVYDLIYDSADYFLKNAIYRHSMDGFEGYSNKSPAIKSSTGSGNQIIINEAICKSNTDKGHSSNNDLRHETPKVIGNTDEKFEQESRVFSINGKSPTLLANRPQEKSKIMENRRIRRLTPTECARLQTIPDWYKWECSDTQQYKMLGNGWTVEVIKHIFSFINK